MSKVLTVGLGSFTDRLTIMRKSHQNLPASGPPREALREKGQFWTPGWVAEAMVKYVLRAETDHVFDPAAGAGAFLLAAKQVGALAGRSIRLLGTEVDPNALQQAREAGLSEEDLRDIEIRDFVLNGPERKFSAIVANPPYIRHHRINEVTKAALKLLAKKIVGKTLDGRTGYHVFFFIKALERLAPRGRLAFIMPADTCEGIFAETLWKWVMDTFRLEAVVTFSHEATPFPNVDTNALIFMISAAPPVGKFAWCKCKQMSPHTLKTWVDRGFPEQEDAFISSIHRDLLEGYESGLSRPRQDRHVGPVLGDFAKTVRGIATGGNEFFFLTRERVDALGIPLQYTVRAIGRTRDIEGDEITPEALKKLEDAGRPTYLLSLDGRPGDEFPPAIRTYLKEGLKLEMNKRALIKQRRAWYKMECREVPPFLFAYLGRRSARFIRNRANVVPLTGFLCVYPKTQGRDAIEKVWRLLSHPDTLANLHRVAKSYGSGAIKVEPRALERVPLTERALSDSGLSSLPQEQVELAF
jgi:adenine-specific DNA-methyltransferase